METLAYILISTGLIFFLGTTIGLLRFPDFYSRMHAAGKCDTLGSLLLLVGLAIYQGFDFTSVKLLVIAIFIFLGEYSVIATSLESPAAIATP